MVVKPQMIIFDYGHTLLYEPNWNVERGNRELLKYVTKNPKNCSLADIQKEIDIVFYEINNVRKSFNYDIPCVTGQRLAYEHLGIEFSLTPLEQEIVFWSAATPGAITKNADVLLDYLNRKNIRSAVISNNGWSGEALQERFDRLLPNNKFEFIISSSDYMIRKPDKRIFEISLNKANLKPSQVWYCGDSIDTDVYGAHNAGIFPVFYQGVFPTEDQPKQKPNKNIIDFDYLKIGDWLEMVDILNNLT